MTNPFHPDLIQPGDMVRHYRVVSRLGSGGFANVFLVEHGGRPYTLKIAARPPGDEDEAREDERAFREAISLGHFRHPNLLTVRELGRWPDLEGGHFFFVTDHVPGSTFNTWRWRTQASLRRFIRVLAELVLVMAELHERGVCHRDIKPDNVLVREGDDKPFLIDFGAVFLPGAYTLTRELPPVTFHNMPPEVAAFLRGGEWEEGAHFPASPAADLYALGALLYEALTDCHPFNPRLPLDKLLLAIEFVPPVEPGQLEPRVPPGLSRLVMRLLDKDPAQRPPSARAVHEELMRLLESEGDTEAWTQPYAFATQEDAAALPGASQSKAAAGTREVSESPPVSESAAPAAPDSAGTGGEERGTGRPSGGWWRGLAVFAFVLLLLGIAWGFGRTVFASALEAVCSGAASTALVPPAPSEKGCEALLFTPPKSFRDTHALLCAASVQLLACSGVPVRPDAGGFLEQCPPEARQTAARAGFGQMPFTDVELVTGVHVGTVASPGMLNVKSGPVEGWMFLPGDERSYRVTGEAKVFQKRFYAQFDRIYLDALYPTPGIVPSPICAVVVSDREPTKKFGVLTYEVDKPIGAELDPAKVVYRGADAAILNAQLVDVYVQLPGRHFPK
ncbi:serine/threonine-protein kinase [Archangium gephyra]|uniref:Serine/threonine-protein kinase n=1 Tax=Archangium gephyra TaxID=48 RepID=A0AAC8TAL0_9BACT|nr:serine/threonine-protein kinase [Archangium gephyra]AKI98951.1 Serine/threonine protein kinase [Archangium gephyra]REG30861.1 serine/threonine-protein kinase [Archangium gephyra]